jgi:hypothetical protein
LTLTLDGEGQLLAEGRPLDDRELEARLAAAYGPAAAPDLRAVAVAVSAATPRTCDQEARRRLIAAAVRAQAWVIPVFALTD